MSRAITCKQCGFLTTVELNNGKLVSFAPDQATMKQRCRKTEDLSFAYDCAALTSALLKTLESESRFSLTPSVRRSLRNAGSARNRKYLGFPTKRWWFELRPNAGARLRSVSGCQSDKQR
jgi:hypothetical protein